MKKGPSQFHGHSGGSVEYKNECQQKRVESGTMGFQRRTRTALRVRADTVLPSPRVKVASAYVLMAEASEFRYNG